MSQANLDKAVNDRAFDMRAAIAELGRAVLTLSDDETPPALRERRDAAARAIADWSEAKERRDGRGERRAETAHDYSTRRRAAK